MGGKNGMKGNSIYMKRIKEKLNRTLKYWRVSYRQASGKDRLFIGMCALVMLVYAWWVMLVL
jgi:hypothetical protein